MLLGANPILWLARSNTTTFPSMTTSPNTAPDGLAPILRQWNSLRRDVNRKKKKNYILVFNSQSQQVKNRREAMRARSQRAVGVKREKREWLAVGFNFGSDWLRKWRKFSRPIIECHNAKWNERNLGQHLVLSCKSNIFKNQWTYMH